MFHSLDVNITVTDQSALPVKLGIELRILTLAIVVDLSLFIDLGPERLNEADVCVDT